MLPILRRRVLPYFEQPGGPGGGPPPPPPEPPAGQHVFTREYVQELRTENAGWRVKLKQEQDAHAATRRQLGMTIALSEGLARHGLDAKLTRALLTSEPERLADLDPAAPDIASRVDEALTLLAKEYPQLQAGARPAGPARNGLPMSGGGGSAPPITRAELQFMTPDQIAELQKAGKLRHLSGR
jgi:hypothetical protein